MKPVSPDLTAAVRAGSSHMVYLAKIDHPTGMVYLNSGVLPVEWDGETYVALGKMGAVTGISQSMDGKSQEVVMSMAAPLLDDTAQDIISESVAGREAFIWQSFLTPEWQVIPDPIQLANITMDGLEVAIDEGGSQTLQIRGYMTQFAARRVMPVYYSNEAQQDEFPGDTGMDRMAELADKVI